MGSEAVKNSVDLSIVIPTYNEEENIEELINKIQSEFKKNKIFGEIIVVDDNSKDKTRNILEKIKIDNSNLKTVYRSGKLGLSSAVIEGWKVSSGKILGVMDADLSHLPEKIKDLFFPIKNKEVELTIGSRYVKGGKIIGWNLKRKIMSRGATYLSRVYTSVKDPMTGYFMLNREIIKNSKLNARGFKILLEVILKGNYKKIKEVPITFVNRTKGKSKAGMGEIFFYLRNLLEYIPYTRKPIKEFFKFGVVGAIGTLINVGVLFSLTELAKVYYLFSAIISFFIAMTSNFILNKIWTFREEFKEGVSRKFAQFSVVSILALIFNLAFLYIFTEFFGIHYLISQLLAICLSLIINFIGNKLWTFSKQ